MKGSQLIVAVLICAGINHAVLAASIKTDFYGYDQSGDKVSLFTLSNDAGMSVSITNYRGIITAINVPNNNQEQTNVVLGHDNLAEYQADNDTMFGAIVGRYANRIKGAAFTLDGQDYHLMKNDGDNCLHGGMTGMNQATWKAKALSTADQQVLTLQYTSPAGEQGFPGNLAMTVTYALDNHNNQLSIQYAATTDKATDVNLTNHSYFNLDGRDSGNVLEQYVKINADNFLEVDKSLIPTGRVLSVKGTPLDFHHAYPIGARVFDDSPYLTSALGYDHTFVLNKSKSASALEQAASAYSKRSGIQLTVSTTQPGLQFYSGNHLDNTKAYPQRGGFALETQHYPDSPHQAHFPSTLLEPKQTYSEQTIYRFSVLGQS